MSLNIGTTVPRSPAITDNPCDASASITRAVSGHTAQLLFVIYSYLLFAKVYTKSKMSIFTIPSEDYKRAKIHSCVTSNDLVSNSRQEYLE